MANTTFNPSDKGANITLTGSNLIATLSSTGNQSVRAIDKQVSGKFYWECTGNTLAGSLAGVGIAAITAVLANSLSSGASAGTCSLNRNAGQIYVDGTIVSGISLGAINSGTVVCVAFDCDARLIWFRLGAAGNWNASAPANPATGAGGVLTTIGRGIPAYPAITLGNTSGDQITANFGDSAFTGTVPSGFTSGFTAGVTTSTNALATQAAVEHWITTNPDAQVTQVALEHWASVAAAVPGSGALVYAMVMA